MMMMSILEMVEFLLLFAYYCCPLSSNVKSEKNTSRGETVDDEKN